MTLRFRPRILWEPLPLPWQDSVLNKDKDSSRIGQLQENPLLETPGSQASDREHFLPQNKSAKKTHTARSCKRANTYPGKPHAPAPGRIAGPGGCPRPGQRHTAWPPPGAQQHVLCPVPVCERVSDRLPEVCSGPGHGANCLWFGPCFPSSGLS